MNFIGDLLSSIFGGGRKTSAKTARPTKAKQAPPKPVDRPEERLEVLAGRVVFVGGSKDGRGFAKVEGEGVTGILFPDAVPVEDGKAVKDYLTAGQNVEFVVVQPNPRNASEYILSLTLAEEVRARRRLAQLEVGDRVEVEVVDVKPNEVRVTAGAAVGRISAVELADCFVEACGDACAVGDAFTVEVMRKVEPRDWRRQNFSRHRGAFFQASRRRCLPPRDVRVPVFLSAMPFKLAARPNLPRRFDPVVETVFGALGRGRSAEDVSRSTALSPDAVGAIERLLLDLGLVAQDRRTTPAGDGILRAMEEADTFNARTTGGWFISSAPKELVLAPSEGVKPASPPGGWPSPLLNKGRIQAFLREPEKTLASYAFDGLFDEEVLSHLHSLNGNRQVRVFVEVDRERRWNAPVSIDVPDTWILGLLWSTFRTAEREPPFRPSLAWPQARQLLVAECRRPGPVDAEGRLAGGDEGELEGHDEHVPDDRTVAPSPGTVQTVYWEPHTDTLWENDGATDTRFHSIPGSETPALPPDLAARLAGPSDAQVPLEFVQWVRLDHKPRRNARTKSQRSRR